VHLAEANCSQVALIRAHGLRASTRSFFQSVCVLGYCICPLVMAALIGLFVPVVIVRAIVVVGAFLWSSYGTTHPARVVRRLSMY